jgi:hypothetical protein
VILYSNDSDEVSTIMPLRLKPAWHMAINTYIQEVDQKIAAATKYAGQALEIITRVLPACKSDFRPPTLDVGYVYCSTSGEGHENGLDRALRDYTELGHGPQLLLEAREYNGTTTARFSYDKARFGPAVIEMLASYLESLIEESALNIKVKIGDVMLGGIERTTDLPDTLSNELFNF